MTATLQPETKSSSRRALLAGALGGIGAWAASALGRASPVQANGETIHVGDSIGTATSVTRISNVANTESVLWGESVSGQGVLGSSSSFIGVRGSSTSGTGVYGNSDQSIGVQGHSNSNIGVKGDSTAGAGVYGISASSFGVFGDSSASIGVIGVSQTGHGVEGRSNASDQPATVGWSTANSTGLQGFSGGATPPAPRPKTGVYGNANQDIFSTGVYGLSAVGVGVRGKTTSGYAGYFEGRVYTNAFYELGEVGTPTAPLANRARLFVRDNGAGKTQLCVRFHTGVVRVLTTEP